MDLDRDTLGTLHLLACAAAYVFDHDLSITADLWLADILAIILAWWITFTVVITLLLTFGGFGPGGIIAGRFA
jgi:hypothetical protein